MREFHASLPSTQDRALELARAGAAPGTTVVAGQQTLGRGRLDHRWSSPVGGLYLSIVLSAPRSGASLFPVALGARLATDWTERYRVPFAVKWPNDLFVVPGEGIGRKVGGVLVDRIRPAGGGDVLVVGVGVNVRRPVETDPDANPRTVAWFDGTVLPVPPLDSVEADVVGAARGVAELLDRPGGPAEALATARSRLYGVGAFASVDGAVRGRIAGLADDGALWLDTGSDRVSIRAGDLRVDESR